MPFILAVVLILFALGLFGQLVQLAVMLACKLRIEVFQIFYGRPVATRQLGNMQLALGWIPTGLSTKYDVSQFAAFPWFGRMAVILVPPLALVGCALLLLGLDQGWHHFVTGFRQFVEGAFHPQSVGSVLLEKLHFLYQQSPRAMIGVLAGKVAASMLLPIGNAGALVLREIISPESNRREWFEVFLLGGALLLLLGYGLWVSVLISHALKHSGW